MTCFSTPPAFTFLTPHTSHSHTLTLCSSRSGGGVACGGVPVWRLSRVDESTTRQRRNDMLALQLMRGKRLQQCWAELERRGEFRASELESLSRLSRELELGKEGGKGTADGGREGGARGDGERRCRNKREEGGEDEERGKGA